MTEAGGGRARRFANYIGGVWVESDRWSENRNPSDTLDVVGEYAQANDAQTDAAIDAAGDAFPAWSVSNVQERAEILERVGGAMLARRDELGRQLSREEGRALPDALNEVSRAAQIFKFFAGEALRNAGELVTSTRTGVEVAVTREPVGVVGIISPWNVPLAIPAWKIAPALAYGNCVVFKPAELVPASAWSLTHILVDAGLPAGVFNLVMGPGRVVGARIAESRKIDAISFTGSVATGAGLALQAVRTGKKLQLEMGGKNALIVLDDADLDRAVNCALDGAYYWTGQRCTASSRLVVTDGIHERFVGRLLEKMRALTVGHALKAGTQIGPVVDQKQLDQDLRYIGIAREEGGTVFGGELLTRETPGFYLAPALVTHTTPSMRINREEVFGPVASVIRVRDYEEALAVANDTEFGLSSGICTNSLKHASHFRRHAQAGLVNVNLPTAGVDYHVPFGGRKASSYGPREQGRYAAEFYTAVKTAYIYS
ncbi:MAG TPA: aldehyde dehydrogenase family protein [Steroidobacteraceae bacterium]|jgi:aldehyde dehydrogenase (NAD+)